MKTALITVLLFYTPQAVPEAEFNQWWDTYHFGAPCSTKTDIEEGTCDVDILSKPRIVKGTKMHVDIIVNITWYIDSWHLFLGQATMFA
jgi:hypothetical protein